MEQLLGPLTRATLLFAAMLALTAFGFAFARRYRDRAAKDSSDTSEMMTNFRELHAEGGLSDEEFRTIKTKLADELRTELTTNLTADLEANPEAKLETKLETKLNDNSSTG